jgi:hypothetical protein
MGFTRRLAAIVLLVAIVGLTLAIVAPSPARGAGAAPVLVTNTPTQPVPVALQGTGSVAGTVNALQGGSWTVGVSSLPAVQLAAGTAITLSSSPAAPIYNEETSAKQAFAVSVCDGSGSGACPPGGEVALPAGKRFVIEQISGICRRNGNPPATFYVLAPLNGQTYQYFISGVQGLEGSGDTDYIMVGARTHLYADTSVGISRWHDSTDECQVTLSGHLISLG